EKATGFDTPLPGFSTRNLPTRVHVRSAAESVVVSCEPAAKTVGRAPSFHNACAFSAKPLPESAIVRSPEPASALAGDAASRTGAGRESFAYFTTRSLPPAAPGTFAVPGVASADPAVYPPKYATPAASTLTAVN